MILLKDFALKTAMSYRRSATHAPGTSRWRRRNRSKLSRWLPDCVVCDDRRLTYVLLHGSDDFGTGWTPDWLLPQAAAEFLAFLESEFSELSGYEIFVHLRRRKGTTSRTGKQVREVQEERERAKRHKERQRSGKR